MNGSPMRKVALRNLAAHKVRLALTVLSVVLGTAFIAGSFVFTDTLQRTFDGLFASQAKGVDVRVSPKEQQSFGVPLGVVDMVSGMEGVRAVAPSVNGPLVLLDPEGKKPVQTGGAPSWGESYVPPEHAVAEPPTFVAGTPPTKAGEVAINSGGAEVAGLKVGDRTKIMIPSQSTQQRPVLDVTISGIYELPSDTGGFIGLYFDDAQARQLFTDGTHVAWIDIAATGSGDELRDRIAAALPDFKVQNGEQVRADMKAQVSQALNFINYFLLAFGAIALIVGTFIIYNTFAMIVAQRLRELALLRAVGASSRQVGGSVVAEALVIGAIGSVIGLAAGIGLAFGLSAVLNAFDLGLPTGSMAVLPRTVIVALVVGLVVTVISAYAPARRAAKIPPVEAMREEFASAGESLRIRTAVGAVLAVLGVVLVLLGSRSTGGSAAATVGVGAFALILAVLLASPALSRPAVGGLGVLIRPFGPIGRMARNNAARNPRRTAATAFALTLGLMLVSLISMLGASAKASVAVLVDKGVESEYVLAGPQQSALIGLPLGVPDAVRAGVPEAAEVIGFRGVAVKVGDDRLAGVAPDGPIDSALNYEILQGTDTLGERGIMVSDDEAAQHNWRAGQQIELTTLDRNQKVPVTIAGVYKKTPLLGDLVVPPPIFEAVTPTAFRNNFYVLVNAKPGADVAAMRADLEKATDQFAVVQVQDREQFKGAQGRQINTLLAILYGLLALAVVIAILGIINTLALSVVERRREIGMLRAVGTMRSQIRRTIYLESMLIAVFGAIVGVVLGIGLGVGFLRTLRDFGIDQIDIPVTQLVLVLISSAVVGVLAALWPGIRAARTPPLAAIADI
ncbi:putative ABC transport system permease protein [Nocardia amikacinitolerans]|uniref:Putative ABC transport system permease protein n=1 Tax=Nocardia amikacinitolerans TaxID=756689 RepID=A0A285LAL0_9NOCA|nr:FtsX-like permease family protein [Nocardia amikacinitolerans]SNY80636.1 putative ABC transport system permease protein [Nocardia amikacinitolerans]